MDIMSKQYSVEVDKLHAKYVKDKLKEWNLLDQHRKIASNNNNVLIPVINNLDDTKLQELSNKDATQYPEYF
jgi:hypothetical protein